MAAAAMTLLTSNVGAQSVPARSTLGYNLPSEPVSKFNTSRHRAVSSLMERMEKGKPSRFVKNLDAVAEDGTYKPDFVFESRDLYGDLDGPDGELWYYQGSIEYEYIKHNEYWTEELPKSFEISIYDADMNLRGTVKDSLELKEDEIRVRFVDVLPIVTRKYFNQDDNYEVAVVVMVNPRPYGVRSYTNIYSLGAPKDEAGNDVPVSVIRGRVSDVLNASDSNGENVIMSFMHEYNDSGLGEEDIFEPNPGNPDDPVNDKAHENFWKYNLGNKIGMTSYAAAGPDGKLTEVFSKNTVFYQSNGNQQDDPVSLTLTHNGKPVIVYPYYEEPVYNPFYSNNSDMTQRQPNNLVIEVYEQDKPGEQFTLKQTTKLPVIKSSNEDVICSYYGLGGFRYRDDVVWDGDKANFIVTRRDYVASSDSERMSFAAYDSEGNPMKSLFENANGYVALSDLDGFDPMELFVVIEDGDYIFNFVNMRTFETELKMSYGLKLDGEDGDPDYLMANLDRTLTPDGKSFSYVAEMRQPGYDDINDITYMRVAWINRDGSFDHFDNINMGNNVKYAILFLDSPVLQPDFFLSDKKQEYMMLIKRAMPDGTAQEQLLIGQVADEETPKGKDILLLGPTEDGALSSIIPLYGKQNRLSVSWGNVGGSRLTTHYYNLPLDNPSGIENIVNTGDSALTVNGTLVSGKGLIEIYDMRGMRVASGRDNVSLGALAPGIYVARSGGSSVKVAVK